MAQWIIEEEQMDQLQAKANFSRICQLLVDKGGDALRQALHDVHPPSTLAAALNSHLPTLKSLKHRVINPSQWKLLYPAAGGPDSKTFDVTLLVILLRNICGLPTPVAGWNTMPPVSDTSISANILRIKMFRNEVYGHIPSAQYDDMTFQKLWQEISQPLLKLGIPQQDIDLLKLAPLSPEEESYVKALKEWKIAEDSLSQKVDEICKLMKLQTTAHGNLSNVDKLAKFDFKGKIDALSKKFLVGTRQWFFDKLSTWFCDEESKVMILTAGPGIGKSVLAAKVCELYKQSGQLAGCHFCDYRKASCGKASSILQSLASQMCDNVVGFRDKLTELLQREHSWDSLSDANFLLLNEPLHSLDTREPMLIIVDALDETATGDKSEFLELISDEFLELPKWIKILITSRPELPVRKKLEHFKPLEIRADSDWQTEDVEYFIQESLPNISRDIVGELIGECNGSFLYAYYMVTELKERHVRGESIQLDFVPKGISGFYSKQFERLSKGLQRFIPGILDSFINVIAASEGPIPIPILVKCMELSDEDYVIRSAIINDFSEILPVYDDSLVVYHKSLTDWLTLDGYEEHAFAADVADGTKRLWNACKSIYKGIDSLKSISDFEITPEKMFALENGGEYLVNVSSGTDFEWLVNTRINALKFRFCGDLGVDYFDILNDFKRTLSVDLYWSITQHAHISARIRQRKICGSGQTAKSKEIMCRSYLQCLANAWYQFVNISTNSQIAAIDILNEEKEIWLDKVVDVKTSSCKILSDAVIPASYFTCSPNDKLLVCLYAGTVQVFELPELRKIFKLNISQKDYYRNNIVTFSPDSSYFLYNSIKTCICISKQEELDFIPHGPDKFRSCSFSSCGTKLVTSHEFIEVWDVKKKDLIARVQDFPMQGCFFFSSCNTLILQFTGSELCTRDSRTLQTLSIHNGCSESCLKKDSNFQIIQPINVGSFKLLPFPKFEHFHLTTGEIAINVSHSFSRKPFRWKKRTCLLFWNYPFISLFDVIRQELIYRFRIDCMPFDMSRFHFPIKLDGTNFLFFLKNIHAIVVSFETLQEHTVDSSERGSLKCISLSPDNLYVASCYGNGVLTITNVDNGVTVQTVKLLQSPKACWWSELFLFVVCSGVVVKFPYDSVRTNVLGNCVEECAINVDYVLKSGKGVMVFLEDSTVHRNISILKIFDNKLFYQQSLFPSLFRELQLLFVSISSDGCAILLQRTSPAPSFQLWEFSPESGWKLDTTECFFDYDYDCLSLTGTQNSRTLLGCTIKDYARYYFLYDFSSRKLFKFLPLHLTGNDKIERVFNVGPSFLLALSGPRIHVCNDNTVTTLDTWCDNSNLIGAFSFYLSSKGLFIFALRNDIIRFKIRNVRNCLES